MKKENFNLKLRLFHLEEAMEKMSPEGYNTLAKEVWGEHVCFFLQALYPRQANT